MQSVGTADRRGRRRRSSAAPDENQPRRALIEIVAEEVAECGADRESAGGEHRRDLAKIVRANAFEVTLLTDRYPFVEGMIRRVEPSFDADVAHRRFARLALHEPLELAVNIEVVEEKDRTAIEYARHLPHYLLVFILVGEVAEAGKEVDESGKAAGT